MDAGDTAEMEALFTGLKKKKKKGTTVETTGEERTTEPEEPLTGDVDENALFSADLKKKKKKKSKKEEIPLSEDGAAATTGSSKDVKETESGEKAQGSLDGTIDGETEYVYQDLLSRIFTLLRQNNPELAGERRKFTIPPPQVAREGSKKTLFSNIVEICKRMQRQPDHFIQYLFSELGTTGSVDGAQRLLIKGRFQPKQIEIVLKKYLVEYVQCKTCRSLDTLLIKENRLFFLQCEACGSKRTVSAIKSGFQAQIGKRSKQRAAAG